MYLTQKTAAIKPISLKITRAVSSATSGNRVIILKKGMKNATIHTCRERCTWYKFCIGQADVYNTDKNLISQWIECTAQS